MTGLKEKKRPIQERDPTSSHYFRAFHPMAKYQTIANVWSWLRTRLSSPYILKKWLRATITLVATLIFIVNPSTSRMIGEAGIYTAALAVALPPFLPVSAHIYMICVLLFLLPVSWAWTCISTAIAFAVRNKPLLQRQIQLAEAWTNTGIPSVLDEYLLIESGLFLDTQSSAVFGICFFIGSFFFALCLGHTSRLKLPLFFGLTLVVILFSVNPLLPYASYLSACNFLKGAAFYSAVSIATLLFVFPESYHQTWLPRLRKDVFPPIIEFLKRETQQALNSVSVLDPIINIYDLEKGLFETEFSIHRLEPLEFNMLFKHIKQLVGTVKALEVCQRRMHEEVTSNITLTENEDTPFRVVKMCHDLRSACRLSLLDVDEWLRECVSDSWADTFAPVDVRKVEHRRQRLDISRSNLLQAKIKFQNEEVGNITSLGRLAEPIQHQDTVASAYREWLNTSTFADAIESLSTHTASLLSFLIEVEGRYPKPVPRFPCFLKSISRSPKHISVDVPHLPPTLPILSPGEESQISGVVPPKDDTSTTTLPFVSRATRKRPALLEWLASPQTIYAFRVALLSVALYSLGLCKTTVSTYFSYGGFVSMILAQSYVAVYAGDQIFFFILRLCATVEALLFVLGGWLSVAGEGPVNPYAFVVMTTLTCMWFLLLTISSSKRSHILFGVIYSTTAVTRMPTVFCATALVFTWGEVNLNTAPPLQIVFKNIWVRVLLDVIGFVASAIVMMIPFPVTSRRGFHDTLSASLIELSEFVRCYWTENTAFSSSLDDSRAEVICSMMRKQDTMEHFLTTMKYDPCIRALPSSFYHQIFYAQKRLVAASVAYLEALGRLDTSVRRSLSVHLACLQPDMLDKLQDRIGLLVEKNHRLQQIHILRADIQVLGDFDALYSLDSLDSNISENQLLILSSAIVNFAAMVKEIDELVLLLSDKMDNTIARTSPSL